MDDRHVILQLKRFISRMLESCTNGSHVYAVDLCLLTVKAELPTVISRLHFLHIREGCSFSSDMFMAPVSAAAGSRGG